MRIFESLAILDYLEAKYPIPELMPKELDKLAIARMISMVSLTELQPAAITLSGAVFYGKLELYIQI